MEETAFKVRFNFQNLLKEDIDENDYRRISGCLDINIDNVKNLIFEYQKSVQQQAEALDKVNKYSLAVDQLKKKKVVFIGDSITSDRESFAHIISSVFSAIQGLEFVNVGVSGWRTTEFLDDFYFRVLNHNAQIAHVMLGTNGMRRSRFDYGKCNVSPAEFERNIRFILRALTEHGTQTIISTLPPYDLNSETYDIGNWTVDQSDYDEYNDIIEDSTKKEDCILNDMRDIYSLYDTNELLEEDGVHLNKRGHYILAEQVIEKLIRILNK